MSKFEDLTGSGLISNIGEIERLEAQKIGLPSSRKDLVRLYGIISFITGQYLNSDGSPIEGYSVYARTKNGSTKPTPFSGADAAIAIIDTLRGAREPETLISRLRQTDSGAISGGVKVHRPFEIRPKHDDPFIDGMSQIFCQIANKDLRIPKVPNKDNLTKVVPASDKPLEIMRHNLTGRALIGCTMSGLIGAYPDLNGIVNLVDYDGIYGFVTTERIDGEDHVSQATFDLDSFEY